MKSSRVSVYQKALSSKQVAAYVLLPLIEFEFSFYGSKKPWISQSIKNAKQLEALFRICKAHNWVTGPIRAFRKNEASFKLNNKGFGEIYELAGPMADDQKDAWARLLSSRAGKFRYLEEKTISVKDILRFIRKSAKPVSVKEICLAVQRLPNSVSRHLKNLKEAGLVGATEENLFFPYERASANSSP